jgi:thiamine-monophosphate kinase
VTGPGPVVGDVGEIDLLHMLEPYLDRDVRGLVLAAGDDGAIWQPRASKAVVVTTDSLVEDVHFHRLTGDIGFNTDLGWKLLAISLSDLAAMGASAGPSFLALSFPPDWPVADVEALYKGLAACARAHGATLAGGNLSGAAAAVLTSTCLGEVAVDRALRRSGAQPGWKLAVTGRLGGAAAAMRVVGGADPAAAADDAAAAAVDDAAAAAWRGRLRRPRPRLVEAVALAEEGIPVCIDVSDGLFLDAGRLLQDGLGVIIDPELIPLEDCVREAFSDSWIELAGGGEDYELLFAGPVERVDAACRRIVDGGGEATAIGGFDTGAGVRLGGADGARSPAPSSGYQHFQGAVD